MRLVDNIEKFSDLVQKRTRLNSYVSLLPPVAPQATSGARTHGGAVAENGKQLKLTNHWLLQSSMCGNLFPK
jgi:hypothetical protein